MSWSVYRDEQIRRDGFVVRGGTWGVSEATWKRAVARDGLIPALPGSYLLPEYKDDLAVWLRLVCRRYPTAIVVGRSAWEVGIRSSGVLAWPPGERCVEVVDRFARPDRRPFRFSRRTIPTDFVLDRNGIRRVVPVFAAAELLAVDGGAAACDFLRRTGSTAGSPGMTSLCRSVAALARVPGHSDRIRILEELRSAPWSILELHLHRLLCAAGIGGWTANTPIVVGGRVVHPDVAFPGLRVAIEADGRQHHSSALAFEGDRERWNLLAAAGWTLLRVTWTMVERSPDDVIEKIRAALASRL